MDNRRGVSTRNVAAVTGGGSERGDNPVIPRLNTIRKKTELNRQRIFISGVNSLIGHALFEQMRNDHEAVRDGKKSNKFAGTLIKKDSATVPPPNEQIKIVDGQRKPKTFGKSIIGADSVVIDLVSGTDLDEAEKIIQILRQPLHEHQNKKQTLIVLSPVFTWARTEYAEGTSELSDEDFQRRVPYPRFQMVKHLENLAMTASKFNENIRVHVICSGLPYGHGEANDVFYEFFRRAWLSLHPELASLPVIDSGDNVLPTIHVHDLSRFVKHLCCDTTVTRKSYFIAVDECKSSTQREIIQTISTCLGRGDIQNVPLSDVIDEEWSEMLTLNLRMQLSPEFARLSSGWHCREGITVDTMKLLNDEFNMFRGLFPLKVFIGGPPGSGKTHFTSMLAESYGIPHLLIGDMIEDAKKAKDDLGDELRACVEALKDEEVAQYEKSRKKKDLDLDRSTIKVRLPSEMLQKIVKARVAGPACMNKGFILDGYPRNMTDAKVVFLNPIPGYEAPEAEAEEEKKAPSQEGSENGGDFFPGFDLDHKILPQYTVIFEAENDLLKQKMKDLPPSDTDNTNKAGPAMDRRLNTYRELNANLQADSHIHNFFVKLIGDENCMLLDKPEETQNVDKTLKRMRELLEQNGKPCCLNLITDADNKFLKSNERMIRKEAREAEMIAQGSEVNRSQAELDILENKDLTEEERQEMLAAEEAKKKNDDSASEVDEIEALIEREEHEARTRERESAERKLFEEDAELDRIQREKREKEKLEQIRENERDLLDKRSQPIRQYLMDKVVPYLTEGLINLCKEVPEDPTDFLANFLLKRADEIDEELIRQRDDEIRRKAAERTGSPSHRDK